MGLLHGRIFYAQKQLPVFTSGSTRSIPAVYYVAAGRCESLGV